MTRADMQSTKQCKITALKANKSSWNQSRAVMAVTFWLLVSLFRFAAASNGLDEERKCEEITIPMCRNMGYNYTYMPNVFKHATQAEAALDVHQFWPLVEIQCSQHLRFFLCSMYAPICQKDFKREVPPCREVCEQARDGCAPLMKKYGFPWPEKMECDRFKSIHEPGVICAGNNATDAENTTERPTIGPNPNTLASRKPSPGNCCSCQAPFVSTKGLNLKPPRELTLGGIQECAMACNRTYFSKDQENFASFWIGLWAVLCFVSTLITSSTFVIDMHRFKYPERPIIFLSGCYLMVSVGYIIRLIAGHESIACDSNGFIRTETSGPVACTIVFILLYYFGMASSLWWVILTFTWFLSAGMKWSTEAITNYSQYFHVAAWLIPAIQSIAVLAMSTVDGDPVSGVCYVGSHNLQSLVVFVIVPLLVYLVFGTSFLIGGFYSLIRIRKALRKDRPAREKFDKLLIRIGVFSVLYTVPAAIVVACYFYEFVNREKWERSVVCKACDNPNNTKTLPDHSVFIIKYFMALVVGITSGFWIWSGKTIESWRNFAAKAAATRARHSQPKKTTTADV